MQRIPCQTLLVVSASFIPSCIADMANSMTFPILELLVSCRYMDQVMFISMLYYKYLRDSVFAFDNSNDGCDWLPFTVLSCWVNVIIVHNNLFEKCPFTRWQPFLKAKIDLHLTRICTYVFVEDDQLFGCDIISKENVVIGYLKENALHCWIICYETRAIESHL